MNEPIPKRILVVDDDDDIRIALRDRLVSMGFDVLTENNGHSALSRIALEAPRSPIQGVLLDLQMPVFDGIAVLRELHECHREIPVIVMSASGDRAQLHEALQLGACSYLVKPFDNQRAWEQVNKLFQNQ